MLRTSDAANRWNLINILRKRTLSVINYFYQHIISINRSGKKYLLKGSFGKSYLAETGLVELSLADLFNLVDYTNSKIPLYQ